MNHQGGKAFGELKKRQEADLDRINAQYASEATPQELEQYKQKFMEFDINHSGDIDEFELKLMLEKLGKPKTHLELKKMIAEVDTIGEGTIHYPDFLSMMLGKKSSVLQKILKFEELARAQTAQPPPAPKRSLAELISK